MVAELILPRGLGDSLLDEARRAGTVEICGLIAASDGQAPVRYPIANRAARAADRFDMDAAGQIAAFKAMREAGETLLAIYHSHPHGEAEPSMHDRHGHSYPDALGLIIAPAAVRAAAIRAWAMQTGAPAEVAINWVSAL
ncbi:Mov34/MPN/PAD-1 family protein [Salinisphaera hydrothermalis]|uniref:Mov34/MPN/PAD-1 family protein n=1 Tax=Salinisphaera hydrothermalis (strain C41B8) TaxID=1304275 RepID=A0A084IQV3_SALHC|nr:Mov34/MPN/PAD-1 family protein [Salinisphaera hydrothermalis]KEZ79087.1 Mov34/MPN/PAD-1 family protein [Salinisphaera hydrothermalis C41B8]